MKLAVDIQRGILAGGGEFHADCETVLLEDGSEQVNFIEWTAMDAGMDHAAELVELQVQLARWQFHWSKIWADDAKRINVAEQARVWMERVLEMSGLLSEPVASPHQG
ncbi:DUF5674 family protein [Coleofasciculus sp.]|uniref:DUF5674 family protein n=1 Tax=Coleofasciculus sp. TaxID=3100458 RepID=UPI0039FA9084